MSTDRQDHGDDLLGPLADSLRAARQKRRPAEPISDLIAASSLGAALAAEPRSFALPVIPEDVKAVRDAEGMIWYREDGAALTAAGVTDLWWNTDDDYCNAAELLAAGDLTEILPGEFEAPEVLEDNRG